MDHHPWQPFRRTGSSLSNKLKEHSGVDASMWDSWLSVFGRYKALVASVLVSIAIFAAILNLCGCCCIPWIRALVVRLIDTAVGNRAQTLMYQSLPAADANLDDTDDRPSVPDLFLIPVYDASSSSDDEDTVV